MSTTRFAPIYYKNKKVATLENVTYSIKSGNEPLIITEGWDGISEGAVTCDASASCIDPVEGSGMSFIDDLLNKKLVQIGIPIDGKIHQFTACVMGADFSSDAKSGKTTGKFDFSGGKLKVVG